MHNTEQKKQEREKEAKGMLRKRIGAEVNGTLFNVKAALTCNYRIVNNYRQLLALG